MRTTSRCRLALLALAALPAAAVGGETTVLPPTRIFTFMDVKPSVGTAGITLGEGVGAVYEKFTGRLREIWTRIPTTEDQDKDDWDLSMTAAEGFWNAKVGQFADEAKSHLKQRGHWQGTFPKSWQDIVKDHNDLVTETASSDGFMAIFMKGRICYMTDQNNKAAKTFKGVMNNFKTFLAETARVADAADRTRPTVADSSAQALIRRAAASTQLKALRTQLTRMHNWQSAMESWQTAWRSVFSDSNAEPDKVKKAVEEPLQKLLDKIKTLKTVAEVFSTEVKAWQALAAKHTNDYKTAYLQWKADADPLLNGTVFDAYPFLGTKNLKDIHKALDSRIEQWKPLAN
ncbi:MAG: hypothetical protein FJ290_05450 [Planctomycetes bacterium]|nr:hypothetical protein [Planctomycetota bacterium]